MIIISVCYPAVPDSHFDLDYYTGKHIPLVKSRWGDLGLVEIRVLRGTGALDGGKAAYHLIALLTFRSEQDFQKAGQQHGPEIMGDIKNFTDTTPAIQFNEQLP